EFPVGWKYQAILNAEWQSTSPLSQAGPAPSTKDGIDTAIPSAPPTLLATEGKFVHPVRVDLVSHVVVGDSAEQSRIKRIVNFAGSEKTSFEKRNAFRI